MTAAVSGCPGAAAASDVCADADAIVGELIALLPRGRAWGTHDGGPFPGSVLYAFWYAVAVCFAWLEAAACALVPEFFCATASANRDLWLLDYNLPDGCDPFPDLCTKVAALGGTRCDYYAAVCARAGWSITCVDLYDACGTRAGRGDALCGTASAGQGLAAAQMYVEVSLGASAAYASGPLTPPLAGRMLAGQRQTCPPDLTGLECLLARIVGAHKLILFGTVP